jgi:hypothetical protein
MVCLARFTNLINLQARHDQLPPTSTADVQIVDERRRGPFDDLPATEHKTSKRRLQTHLIDQQIPASHSAQALQQQQLAGLSLLYFYSFHLLFCLDLAITNNRQSTDSESDDLKHQSSVVTLNPECALSTGRNGTSFTHIKYSLNVCSFRSININDRAS